MYLETQTGAESTEQSLGLPDSCAEEGDSRWWQCELVTGCLASPAWARGFGRYQHTGTGCASSAVPGNAAVALTRCRSSRARLTHVCRIIHTLPVEESV